DGVTDLISYHKLLGSGIPEFFVPEELRSMVKAGGHQLMMINSEYDTASDEVSQQVAQLRTILKDYDPDAMLTGEAVLTDDLIVTTAVDFRTTNYISMAAIFLIIAIVFKSVTVPLVLVAVIELAIFINLGIPYFTGSEVAFITPTVISCVQLGATVDYAILMTSRFQDELRAGKDRFEAIRIAAKASDPAIITSSLVMLCATLGVSFVSSIDLIGSICTMLARGSVISAVMSIVFLPAILCAAEPLFRRTSYHWLG
ncbi:MAG: MMPL family transporter, partial [Firmicutes bacterium]|nr:MMPL family transporter [Bacillota bacterium]